MNASHGGKAKHDTIDSHKSAALLRGGLLPQAYVYPAAMRATRDLLRRRTPLMRQRVELLAHVQQINRWAFSEAAVLLLRNHPAAQQFLATWANKHDQGKP